MVNITLRLLSRPNIEKLPIIYQQLGLDYDERILPSIANEVLKSVVAQYDAEELLKKREQVSLEVRKQLTQRANDFNIGTHFPCSSGLRLLALLVQKYKY